MTKLSYTVQRPDQGNAILRAYRDLIASTEFSRVTGLYAFASHKGARLLVGEFQNSSSWKASVKRWVVSIDGGITEPEALRFLVRLRKATVWVPDAEALLVRRLKPVRRFHPKTLLLERHNRALEPSAILVGSANLTCNGLCFGHEHALAAMTAGGTSPSLPGTLAAGLVELEKVIAAATQIDETFVDRYAQIRPAKPSLPEDFEDERTDQILQENPVIGAPMAAALAAASHLWVDIQYVVSNRGAQQEGNQIDLQRGTRVFFGFGDKGLPRNSAIGTVMIRYHEHSGPRNLRFGNNSMDKLDLPIPAIEGPPSYSNTTLLFSREPNRVFRLAVGKEQEIARWKEQSRVDGTLFRMQSGREFGVF